MAETSVIIPVYGVSRYLGRCVQSFLSQTYADFELLLIDDGGADECAAMCDEYARLDTRVLVVHKGNGGVSSARNVGLDLCDTRYVTFCDSDDYVLPRFLEELCAAMSRSQSDAVSADIQFVNEDGELLEELTREPMAHDLLDAEGKVEFIVQSVFAGMICWNVWARLFLNDLIQQHGIRFCETCEDYAEDMGFFLEYVLHCRRIDHCAISGYCYVQHESSMMHRTRESIKLNAVNEVSMHFAVHCLKESPSLLPRRFLPTIHYLICASEYEKIHRLALWGDFRKEAERVVNYNWYRKQSILLFARYRSLRKALGPSWAREALLTTSFCVCGTWQLYSMASQISKSLN